MAFNPEDVGRLTLQYDDGSTYAMEGIVRSFNMDASPGGYAQTTVDFIGGGPVVSTNNAITPLVCTGGLILRDEPDGYVIGLEAKNSKPAPWSPETTMLVAMGLQAVATWGLLRLWVLLRPIL